MKEQADMNDIREHCGLTVQRAIEIMEGFGLDPFNMVSSAMTDGMSIRLLLNTVRQMKTEPKTRSTRQSRW